MPVLSIGVLEKRRDAKIKELANLGPVLQGSLCKVKVKCGNPNCKCANGEKHDTHLLTKKVKGKTKSVYVPVEMYEEAKKWTEEYRRMMKLMKEISKYNEMILKRYVKSKRGASKNRALQKS